MRWAPHPRRWLTLTLAVCGALPAACYCANFPLINEGGVSSFLGVVGLSLGLVVTLLMWALVPLVGVYALVTALRARTWLLAVVVAVLVAAVLPTPVKVDWGRVWVDSQVALHRGELDGLASRARSGQNLSGADLPGTLAFLDTDGKVDQTCDGPGPVCGLFLQVAGLAGRERGGSRLVPRRPPARSLGHHRHG